MKSSFVDFIVKKKFLFICIGLITVFTVSGFIIYNIKNNNVKTFEVTFDTQDGNAKSTIEIKENEMVKKPTAPVRKNYKFVEWQLNGKKYNFNTPVKEDITLVAIWKVLDNVEKVSVTFNYNNDKENKIIEIAKGDKINTIETPEKKGAIFDYWEYDGKKFDFETAIDKDITLNAIYKKSYTISFDSNGGNNVGSQNIKEGEKVTKPTNPKRNNYTFVEWQLNGKTYDFNTPVTNNFTLVAKWQKNNDSTYTITFDSNGGSSISSQNVKFGNKVDKPKDPVREGYNFSHWSLNGIAYDFNTPVTGNIKLVAEWTSKNNVVTFNSNGGSNVPSQTLTEGQKASKPSNPSKSGYTFLGWKYNNSYYDFATIVNKNMTLDADWLETLRYTATNLGCNTEGGLGFEETTNCNIRFNIISDVSNVDGISIYVSQYGGEFQTNDRLLDWKLNDIISNFGRYYFDITYSQTTNSKVKFKAYKNINGTKVYSDFSNVLDVNEFTRN